MNTSAKWTGKQWNGLAFLKVINSATCQRHRHRHRHWPIISGICQTLKMRYWCNNKSQINRNVIGIYWMSQLLSDNRLYYLHSMTRRDKSSVWPEQRRHRDKGNNKPNVTFMTADWMCASFQSVSSDTGKKLSAFHNLHGARAFSVLLRNVLRHFMLIKCVFFLLLLFALLILN